MKEPPDIGKVNRQKRKLLWYAVLTTLLGFLAPKLDGGPDLCGGHHLVQFLAV